MNRAIQSYCRPTSITDGGQKMTGVLGASARYIDITAAAAAIDTVVFTLTRIHRTQQYVSAVLLSSSQAAVVQIA